jgi:hypothetical protein
MATDEPHQPDESIRPQDNTQPEAYLAQGEPPVVPHIPPSPTDPQKSNSQKCDPTPPWKKRLEIAGFCVLVVYAIFTGLMYCANKKAADAAKSAADTAHDSLVLSERPWIKIGHRIVEPLTFDRPGTNGPIATITIENTLENVGPTVALNVVIREEIVPMDASFSIHTALARQAEVCDAIRHREGGKPIEYTIFPKDPLVQRSQIGPSMEVILKSAKDNAAIGTAGKVNLMMVGCVAYRSSFEPKDAPSHETRFAYFLGKPLPNGALQTTIVPHGTVPDLWLMLYDISAD